jgi:hypothetical protein
MTCHITTKYDAEIGVFIICLPEFITFTELKQWKAEFLSSLKDIKDNIKRAILIDTNTHQFESIACLKLLRDLCNEPQVKSCISRTAFVSPSQYRKPEMVSATEGYFSSFEEAYNWLR